MKEDEYEGMRGRRKKDIGECKMMMYAGICRVVQIGVKVGLPLHLKNTGTVMMKKVPT
jgi:hypothetical protein